MKTHEELEQENKELLELIQNVRKWYVTEGFDLLAPETPIVFSKLLTPLIKNKMSEGLL